MPSLTSYQVLLLLSTTESIQKSRILFEIIIRNSVGELSYIKSIVCADERQSLEDQCFPVTGNIKEFSFSIRKADHMDPASCLRRNPTFLALRNWVQGIILMPKTNPASLTSGCFYLSSTLGHTLTNWSFGQSTLKPRNTRGIYRRIPMHHILPWVNHESRHLYR